METKTRMVVAKSFGVGETELKKVQISTSRWVSLGNPMCSIVTTANNTVLYIKKSESVDLKCSHHRKLVIMWGDGGVN